MIKYENIYRVFVTNTTIKVVYAQGGSCTMEFKNRKEVEERLTQMEKECGVFHFEVE